MENIAEIVNEEKEGEVMFFSLGMLYAYGQTLLHPDTAKHCNFQFLGGESTVIYAFITGYYGLTIMPPKFQKIMDIILHSLKSTFVLLDDILIVTKGNTESHMKKVEEVLTVIDQAGIRLKIEKCKIAKRETEWLGYKL